MPTGTERVKMLRARAAARLEKAHTHPAVIKLLAKAEADNAEADKQEAQHLKKEAGSGYGASERLY